MTTKVDSFYLSRIRADIDTSSTLIAGLVAADTSFASRIGSAESRLTSAESTISTQLGTSTTRLNTAESSLTSLTSRIETVETSLTSGGTNNLAGFSESTMNLTEFGTTWVAKGTGNWKAVSISSSGQYQTAVDDKNIHISSNYGNTWAVKKTIVIETEGFRSVDVSSTGQYQIAISYGNPGYVYVSNDYGNTWSIKVNHPSTTGRYLTVSISSSGQYQTACSDNDYIYVSSNFGETWSSKSTTVMWKSVSLSSSGQYQSACAYGDKIYVSADYGDTWTAKDENRNWNTISLSSSGQYQTACVMGGKVYVSADYGNTWTAKDGDRNWMSVSVSSSGQYQTICIMGGSIYVSSDYGNTWTAKMTDTVIYWYSVSVSSSGQYQTAIGSDSIDSTIYVSYCGPHSAELSKPVLNIADASYDSNVVLSNSTTWYKCANIALTAGVYLVNLQIGLSNNDASVNNITSYDYVLSTNSETSYSGSLSNIVANTRNKCDGFSSGDIPSSSSSPNNKYTLPNNTVILTVAQTTNYNVYVRATASNASLTVDSALTQCNAVRIG